MEMIISRFLAIAGFAVVVGCGQGGAGGKVDSVGRGDANDSTVANVPDTADLTGVPVLTGNCGLMNITGSSSF
jgi:hypothetical protein